jgi:hypothetical protein
MMRRIDFELLRLDIDLFVIPSLIRIFAADKIKMV